MIYVKKICFNNIEMLQLIVLLKNELLNRYFEKRLYRF